LINELGLNVYDHPNPYPLGWVNKDVELKVSKQCNIKFSISADYIDEVEVDVVPFYACNVVFGSSYIYMIDAIFMRRENYYPLIKDGKSFIINAHIGKSKIYLVRDNQAMKLISSCRKLYYFS
jgi:hypothetical protein